MGDCGRCGFDRDSEGKQQGDTRDRRGRDRGDERTLPRGCCRSGPATRPAPEQFKPEGDEGCRDRRSDDGDVEVTETESPRCHGHCRGRSTDPGKECRGECGFFRRGTPDQPGVQRGKAGHGEECRGRRPRLARRDSRCHNESAEQGDTGETAHDEALWPTCEGGMCRRRRAAGPVVDGSGQRRRGEGNEQSTAVIRRLAQASDHERDAGHDRAEADDVGSAEPGQSMPDEETDRGEYQRRSPECCTVGAPGAEEVIGADRERIEVDEHDSEHRDPLGGGRKGATSQA